MIIVLGVCAGTCVWWLAPRRPLASSGTSPLTRRRVVATEQRLHQSPLTPSAGKLGGAASKSKNAASASSSLCMSSGENAGTAQSCDSNEAGSILCQFLMNTLKRDFMNAKKELKQIAVAYAAQPPAIADPVLEHTRSLEKLTDKLAKQPALSCNDALHQEISSCVGRVLTSVAAALSPQQTTAEPTAAATVETVSVAMQATPTTGHTSGVCIGIQATHNTGSLSLASTATQTAPSSDSADPADARTLPAAANQTACATVQTESMVLPEGNASVTSVDTVAWEERTCCQATQTVAAELTDQCTSTNAASTAASTAAIRPAVVLRGALCSLAATESQHARITGSLVSPATRNTSPDFDTPPQTTTGE